MRDSRRRCVRILSRCPPRTGRRCSAGPHGSLPAPAACGTVTKADYPIGDKRPELIFSATGKAYKELTLDKLLAGQLTAEDLRIRPETLELQAQVAESVNRDAFARNLRRAAELIAVPDARLLEIYNALRPYRSSKQELLAMADELEKELLKREISPGEDCLGYRFQD